MLRTCMKKNLLLNSNTSPFYKVITVNVWNSVIKYVYEAEFITVNSVPDYIKEFISIVPHKKKFNFSKTAEILRLSVHATESFNALNAASAWQDISTYANNVNTQPWRKEYHEIRVRS